MKLSNALLPPNHNPVLFFTATILNWQHLLKSDECKQIIISSLAYMSRQGRMLVGGFVIMPNHVHLLFRVGVNDTLATVQRDFMKYTAQQLKLWVLKNTPGQLISFKSTQHDRAYQIWERRPLAIPLYTYETMFQKLNYIHNNPCQERWKLVNDYLDYYYSSAGFYERGNNTFPFLVNYRDI